MFINNTFALLWPPPTWYVVTSDRVHYCFMFVDYYPLDYGTYIDLFFI